jgi:hypothetical protein
MRWNTAGTALVVPLNPKAPVSDWAQPPHHYARAIASLQSARTNAATDNRAQSPFQSWTDYPFVRFCRDAARVTENLRLAR